MATRDAQDKPLETDAPTPGEGNGHTERYRPLPTGTHGLDPELVKDDQRKRLQQAMIELVADRGYPAVRIADLTKLAHVSQPTFYSLYTDKEDLFLCTYDEVAGRTAMAVLEAYNADGHEQRLAMAMRAWAQLAATEPEAVSLLVIGAFGAGPKALERRGRVLEELERLIDVARSSIERDAPAADYPAFAAAGAPAPDATRAAGEDLTIKAIIGGVREVTAVRLREGRSGELPELADDLIAWAMCYPARLPDGLAIPAASGESAARGTAEPSARARRAEGRLPSGRSDLPRQFIVKSQQERIVDATAAIVAEKGLAALTIPEIARRANVSNQTFYDIYPSKRDAFLGAQKVGLHQALGVAVAAYEAHADDWPRAVGEGVRALVHYLVSEPAHAHLTLVDTFAASPEATEIRNSMMQAFAAYLGPGYELVGDSGGVPPVAAEAIAGGLWQVLHFYIESDRIDELCGTVPQLTYFALMPFLGAADAAAYATLGRE
jgi:AcrR family transcriptional regulator